VRLTVFFMSNIGELAWCESGSNLTIELRLLDVLSLTVKDDEWLVSVD